VPGDDRRAGHETGRAGEQVGVAHAGSDDTHQDLANARIVQPHVLDLVGAIGCAQHRGFDLHDDFSLAAQL
jgi:hypothetical protein